MYNDNVYTYNIHKSKAGSLKYISKVNTILKSKENISKIKFSAKNLSKFLITVQDKEAAIIWFLLYLFVHLNKNDNSKEKY